MKRRDFITLLGSAAAWPLATWVLAARAQQSRMKRVGILLPAADNESTQARLTLFRRELEKLGWTEGRNVRFDYRLTGADPERMRAGAAELIRLAPDVILTTSNQAAGIIGQQTRTIPIVFAGAGDPVGTGLVPNMARPGGNMTGFATYEAEIAGKRLELLSVRPQSY
jgi:putative ABC transport system substrate-binding protein